MVGIARPLAPDFSQGVDRKELRQICARFQKVNAVRLSRSLTSLTLRHRDVLEIIPLLYEVNHPLLPGFVSRQTPHGVSSFTPDKTVLNLAKTFSKTFKYRRDQRKRDAIQAIFMMGSSGSLAQAESSDIDLWLCHEESLAPAQVKALQDKAQAIDLWAEGLGLELHTFLIQAAQFRSGSQEQQLGGEHSGSAQHYLLLDEFYRTSIHLAGRYPMWWLIPPDYESKYEALTANLLAKRFIKADHVIDFGCVATIPKGELLGAGLWQLYKSLDAPYKSVLKLLLAEVYAQELPEQESLSLQYKRAIYEDRMDPDELDPYLSVYRRLEAYLLGKKADKRLELVRKAFYLKVGKKLSTRVQPGQSSWQRALMGQLVDEWGWRQSELSFLDARYHWKVDQVLQERHDLMAELTGSYRFLSSYARSKSVVSRINANDLGLLGRKLYATFQRKAGKIERINPGIAPSLWEENVAIHHSSSQAFSSASSAWLMYRDLHSPDDAAFQAPLKKASSIIELIAWSYYNGIVNSQTRLSVLPGNTGVSLHEVRNMLSSLEQVLPMPLPAVPQAQFRRLASVSTMLIYVNVGVDPLADLSEHGMAKISNWNDALSFGSQRNNLVNTIDVVTLNSWSELSAHRFERGETLVQILQRYLQICFDQAEVGQCKLHVHCFCPQRADSIARRVRELFLSAAQALLAQKEDGSVRYIVEIEQRFHVFCRVDNQVRSFAFANQGELLDYLALPNTRFCKTILDPHALSHDSVLREVILSLQGGRRKAMYACSPTQIRVFIADEWGSLLSADLPAIPEKLLQASLSEFYRVITERSQLRGGAELSDDREGLMLFRLGHDDQRRWQLQRVSSPEMFDAFEIQAIAAPGYGSGNSSVQNFDLIVDHMEFPYAEYGAQQMHAIADYIGKRAGDSGARTCMVIDVQLPEDMFTASLQSNVLRYFAYKLQLESRLYAALTI